MMRVLFAILAGNLFYTSFAVPISDGALDDDGLVDWEIFNGDTAIPNSWPWMANIQRYGQFRCGGVIVRKRWILTAAHCVTYPGEYTVILGDHNRNSVEATEQTFEVSQIVIHPSYDDMTKDYDAALLQLSTAPSFNTEVNKINRFADSTVDMTVLDPATDCYLTGWGYETTNMGYWRLAPKLQELKIQIVNDTYCTDKLLGYNNPTVNICYEAPLASSCNGDSGGPVQCMVSNKWYLIAVHSFKLSLDGCRGGPKAGTRISEVNSWIVSTTS